MWSAVVVSSALLALSNGFSITGRAVGQCQGNPGPLPLSAAVEGCTGVPCALVPLEDAVINVIIQAPQDISSLKTRAIAYPNLNGISIPIPFDLKEKSVKEGDVLLYSLSFNINPIFPVGIFADVEFSISDDNGASVACVRVPYVIAPPAQ